MTPPVISVVVLAYGEEPLLGEVIDAVLASRGVDVDLVVVDNGYTGGRPGELAGLRWVDPGRNTGFAGGANLGAARSRAAFVAFLNSDAVVAPDALAELATELGDPTVGIATAQVLLYDEPEVVNSAGNPVHYSLLSWAGGWGDPAELHGHPRDIASGSGCLLMLRRGVFQQLQGFYEPLFAYGEDVELSLRAWQAGLRVRYVPSARVWHRYRYQGTAGKYAALERNRWSNIATLYQRGTLIRLAPGLVAVEAGIWFAAARGHWLGDKMRSVGAVLRDLPAIRRRRRWVQDHRIIPDRQLMPLLRAAIAPSQRSGVSVPAAANALLAALGRLGGVPAEESARPVQFSPTIRRSAPTSAIPRR